MQGGPRNRRANKDGTGRQTKGKQKQFPGAPGERGPAGETLPPLWGLSSSAAFEASDAGGRGGAASGRPGTCCDGGDGRGGVLHRPSLSPRRSSSSPNASGMHAPRQESDQSGGLAPCPQSQGPERGAHLRAAHTRPRCSCARCGSPSNTGPSGHRFRPRVWTGIQGRCGASWGQVEGSA